MKKAKLDTYEQDMLAAFDQGSMTSVITSKDQLQTYRAAARDTFIKDRRVNMSRLSRKWTFRPLDLMVRQLPLGA